MAVERFNRAKRIERRREALREIREELERVRRSEARVAEALGSLRAARQRVEEVVRSLVVEDDAVRDIVREELDAAERRNPSASAHDSDRDALGVLAPLRTDDEDATGDSSSEEDEGYQSGASEAVVQATRRSFRTIGVAAVGVLLVAALGWLGVQAMRSDPEEPPITIAGDSMLPPVEGSLSGASGGEQPADTQSAASEEAERFFTLLPDSATQRAAVYDSLWQARSPIFSPLFDAVEAATRENTVKRALDEYRTGSPSALEKDLLHSALVQYALREVMDADIAVDGQLLRNPCRGASCSALLNFWEKEGGSLGLPPVPDDAPSNTTALRVAENVLVLRTLEDLHHQRDSSAR